MGASTLDGVNGHFAGLTTMPEPASQRVRQMLRADGSVFGSCDDQASESHIVDTEVIGDEIEILGRICHRQVCQSGAHDDRGVGEEDIVTEALQRPRGFSIGDLAPVAQVSADQQWITHNIAPQSKRSRPRSGATKNTTILRPVKQKAATMITTRPQDW